jgi:hypothetical protein
MSFFVLAVAGGIRLAGGTVTFFRSGNGACDGQTI